MSGLEALFGSQDTAAREAINAQAATIHALCTLLIEKGVFDEVDVTRLGSVLIPQAQAVMDQESKRLADEARAKLTKEHPAIALVVKSLERTP